MKIKRDLEFVVFKDGLCQILGIDENQQEFIKFERVVFERRVLGYKRAFAARSARNEVSAVLRIPVLKGIDDTHDKVILSGNHFDILMISPLEDTNPRCLELTIGKKEGLEYGI